MDIRYQKSLHNHHTHFRNRFHCNFIYSKDLSGHIFNWIHILHNVLHHLIIIKNKILAT